MLEIETCLVFFERRKRGEQIEIRNESELLIDINPKVIVNEVTRAWEYC